MSDLTTRILKFLVLVFAVVLASSIFYHLLFQDYETENAIYYEVRDVSAFQGVYIRNETVQRYAGAGAVRYCVEDGAKVGVGSVIAEVYSSEEQIDLRRQIAEKEEELAMLNKVENPGTSENAQPSNLAEQIEERYKAMIRFREQGDLAALLDSRQELNVLMSTYEKITEPQTDFTSRIVALEDEISRLTVQKSAPLQTLTADRSAYFISYIDGYEDALNTDALRTLTPEQIADVTDDGIEGFESSGAIGKLVDGYAWYIVGVFDNTKLRLSEDDTATVRLASLSSSMKVKVESLYSTGDITKTQVILRCDRMTYDVVQHRTERVEILRDTVEGIRVPRSAIRFKKLTEETLDDEGNVISSEQVDTMGVYVLVGEAAEFRKLDIIYEDEDYYLSRLDAGSGYISLYDDIIVRGVMADGE